jgi:type I restriction enzyme S subunit
VSKQFENSNINAQLVYIRTDNPKLYSKYLYIMFVSKKFKNIFESFSSGSAQSQLPMHALRQIEIIIPSTEIIKSFSEIINPIFQKMSDNFDQIQSLSFTRDNLLPKLMSGIVRVGF